MKYGKKLLAMLLSLAMVCALMAPAAMAAGDGEDAVTILYTNDVHTNIDKDITYSKLAAYRDSLENVLLVDAGDHAQGTVYGLYDKGETVIKLMNAVGYDAATLGNHEFDYKMDGTMNIIDWAEYPYLSCNFYHNGELVLKPYQVFEVGGKKIALVGVTTPESIVKSTPAYFMDDAGNFIYSIAGGEDGSELYAAVQAAVDAAAREADYVIGLGHVGIDESSGPWTSRAIIAHTTGFTAFIDGHSHSEDPMETVTDKDGKSVVLTQTGNYFDNVGQMTIAADGTVTTQLLGADAFAEVEPKAEVKALEDGYLTKIQEEMGAVIGYSQVTFDNYVDGKRIVRMQETNSGDFVADAFYHLFEGNDVDVAVINGGGVRNATLTGELSLQTLQTILPWANVMCMLNVTGQELLDALEWGAKSVDVDAVGEDGGFLHVSGLKYTIDASIPSTVQKDEQGIWTGGPTGAYRVKNVQVLNKATGSYEALDLNAHYNLAGIEYTLKELGDGFNMFQNSTVVTDGVGIDYLALSNYLETFPVDPATGVPTIAKGMGYDDVAATGRVTILGQEKKDEEPAATTTTTYTVVAGDSLWRIAQKMLGSGSRWNELYQANKATIKNPNLIYVGQTLVVPAA